MREAVLFNSASTDIDVETKLAPSGNRPAARAESVFLVRERQGASLPRMRELSPPMGVRVSITHPLGELKIIKAETASRPPATWAELAALLARTAMASPASPDTSSLRTVAALSPDVEQAWLEVLRAGMNSAAREHCQYILTTVHACAVDSIVEASATDDGGMTLEFECERTGRALLFAIPDDGSVRYFVAHERDGTRKAGVVTEDDGVRGLAKWLGSARGELPGRGVQIA